jgi:hypothetical protein
MHDDDGIEEVNDMTIPIENQERMALLDQVRLKDGNDKLKKVFQDSAAQDKEAAVNSLNHEDLQFTSLFLLRDEIDKLAIVEQLSERNQIAMEIVKDVLSRGNDSSPASCRLPICDHIQMVHSVLRWMLETGSKDDGLSSEYIQVLDTTVSLLTTLFRDDMVLPIIADLIFTRAERELFNYHLIWAFFEAREPYTLDLIANRLRSPRVKEAKLARRLLAFVPGIDVHKDTEGEQQYRTFQHWLEENSPFLHYRGESFQETSKPVPYDVALKGKYLGRSVSVDSGEILSPLTKEEDQILEEFDKDDEDVKATIASSSEMTRYQSLEDWDTLVRRPLKERRKVEKLGGSR